MAIDINEVANLSEEIRQTKFRDIQVSTCKYNIIPVNMSNGDDKKIIDSLTKALNNFLSSTKKTGTRYVGNRANDVGKKMETGIIEEMKKTALTPTQLGSSGYPDLYIEHDSQRIYIELKTSAEKEERYASSFVLFYVWKKDYL